MQITLDVRIGAKSDKPSLPQARLRLVIPETPMNRHLRVQPPWSIVGEYWAEMPRNDRLLAARVLAGVLGVLTALLLIALERVPYPSPTPPFYFSAGYLYFLIGAELLLVVAALIPSATVACWGITIFAAVAATGLAIPLVLGGLSKGIDVIGSAIVLGAAFVAPLLIAIALAGSTIELTP